MSRRITAGSSMLVLFASMAQSASFELTDSCTFDFTSVSSTFMDGTLIGNYDAESNPDGTQTIPGVWGGSGNNPIALEMTTTLSIGGSTVPSGVMGLHVDPDLGLAGILDLDWIITPGKSAGTSLPATVTATVLFETFHTINPTSLFPGGTPVEIPFAEGSVSDVRIIQTTPWAGPAEPIDGQPGAHRIIAAIPATMSMIMALDDGSETPLEFQIVLTIDGVHQVGNATDFFLASATFTDNGSEDLPGDPLPTFPMDLPTVIPPGETAHVLIDLTPESTSWQTEIDASIEATHLATIPGDIDGDGIVGTNDLLAILAAWGPCTGSCPEDLDGDGEVAVTDVLLVISWWSI